MQDKKPRAPMSAEHKAKLAAAYEAKRATLERDRVNGDERLHNFITTFLYPLVITFQDFVMSDEESTPREHSIRYNRYQKQDAAGKPIGRASCSIELSVSRLADEHGRPAVELFKKLFKRTSKGGWSRVQSASYNSTWVPNGKVYDQVIGLMGKKVLAKRKLEVYEFVQLVNSTVSYEFVPTYFFCKKLPNGLYKAVGDKSSKRMVGPDVKAKLKADKAVVKARCEALNEAIKKHVALERAVNLDMKLQLMALHAKIEQLKAEAGVTE